MKNILFERTCINTFLSSDEVWGKFSSYAKGVRKESLKTVLSVLKSRYGQENITWVSDDTIHIANINDTGRTIAVMVASFYDSITEKLAEEQVNYSTYTRCTKLEDDLRAERSGVYDMWQPDVIGITTQRVQEFNWRCQIAEVGNEPAEPVMHIAGSDGIQLLTLTLNDGSANTWVTNNHIEKWQKENPDINVLAAALQNTLDAEYVRKDLELFPHQGADPIVISNWLGNDNPFIIGCLADLSIFNEDDNPAGLLVSAPNSTEFYVVPVGRDNPFCTIAVLCKLTEISYTTTGTDEDPLRTMSTPGFRNPFWWRPGQPLMEISEKEMQAERLMNPNGIIYNLLEVWGGTYLNDLLIELDKRGE